MPETLRPLDVGELLDRVFSLYRSHFKLFVGIVVFPYLLLMVIQLVLNATFLSRPVLSHGFGSAGQIAALGAGLGNIIAASIVAAVATGATVMAVSDLYLDRATSSARALARSWKRVGVLVGTSIAFGITVMVGCLLLLVPGILWALRYSVAYPAAALEEVGVSGAMRRSATLTKGYWGRIFAVWVLFITLQIGTTMALTALLGSVALGSHAHFLTVFASGSAVAGFLVNVLVAPLLTIALSLLYFDLKVRKEGFDLQVLLQQAEMIPA